MHRRIDNYFPDIMADKVNVPTSSTTEPSSIPPKVIIKSTDMSEDMLRECVDIAFVTCEKFYIEKDIAAQIKKEFDQRHSPTWHVVVGKNFGSYVTHGEPECCPAVPHVRCKQARYLLIS